ncbi:MAG: hypothetical protein K1000chlam4_00461 [Chlamydiae bacterium]|nr:hypothetical protein [Chlamydiota bacterium]
MLENSTRITNNTLTPLHIFPNDPSNKRFAIVQPGSMFDLKQLVGSEATVKLEDFAFEYLSEEKDRLTPTPLHWETVGQKIERALTPIIEV